MIAPANNKDCYFTGIIPDFNFRFTFADCSEAVTSILGYHSAIGDEASGLLASSLVGSFLISDLVKQNTKVSIQLSFFETNVLHSILAYSDRSGFMKGTARFRSEEDVIQEEDALETVGTMKVFRWKDGECIYQSYVTYQAVDFEVNLMKYLGESEQIFSLAKVFVKKENDTWIAKGVILQAIPGVTEEQIETVRNGFRKFSADSSGLYSEDMNSIMDTLRTDIGVKEFDFLEKGIPRAQCDCGREKLKNVMVSFGRQYLEDVIKEIGFVEFTCEFCNTRYMFEKDEVGAIINEM